MKTTISFVDNATTKEAGMYAHVNKEMVKLQQ